MAALLVIPAFTGVFAETAGSAQMQTVKGTLEARHITPKINVSGIRNGKTFEAADVEEEKGLEPDDIVTILVQLDAEPAVKVCEDLKGTTAQNYRAQLLAAQNKAVASLNSALDTAIVPVNNYSVLFNGFSFDGEYRLVNEINGIKGYHAFVAPEWGVPELFNTVSQVHAVEAWDLDYTGEGQVIAIIDTGCKVDHPAFSNDPENVAFTQEDIGALLPQTHAAGAPVDKVYRSAKIPFGWNYQGNNLDISHKASDHGTHVAGIAAGNGGEIVGIAPDAQFVVMQVFSPTGGASFDTIMLALEDTAVLGVASANLSLGHICGEEDYGDPAIDEVLDNVVAAGVNLAMAAGNEANAAFNNAWGTSDPEAGSWKNDGYALVENPDYGLIGGPSTGCHGMSVAAIENSMGKGFYIQPVGGEGVGYIENEENMVKLVDVLGDQTVEYVMIPGAGAPEDYEGLDVEGKVVFVSRGDTTFIEKGYAAQDAGAAACVVYNNVPGEVLRMVPFGTIDGNNHLVHDGNEGQIPHISVTYEVGMAFQNNEVHEMFISAESGMFEAPGGNQPCVFSSWGVPTTMGFKPEIAAPGGQIYSSTDPAVSGKLYDTWDGTSMATPHIAGGMALIHQFVEANFPDATPEEEQNLVDCILMSTADPVYDKGGCYASPRQQGAGEMNLIKAVTTHAYVTVEGTQGNRPKVNFGDDPEKNGTYELVFTVHNFGENELVYNVQPSVLLDEIASLGTLPNGDPVIVYAGYSWDIYNESGSEEYILGDMDKNGVVTVADALIVLRMALGHADLGDAAIADVNQDGEVTVEDALIAARIALLLEEGTTVEVGEKYAEVTPATVTVPANGEAEVTAVLTLTNAAKEYIDTYYDSGAFVEGFLELVPVDNEEEPSLTVTYMGYYGDWNYPRTVGDGYYYEDIPLNSNTYPNTVGFKRGKEIQGLGINPFIATDDMSYYLEDRNAISPNADGLLDNINLLYVGIERNSNVRYIVLDAEGNELDVIADLGLCTKGYFDANSKSRDQLGVNYGQIPGNYDYTQFGEDDLVLRIEASLGNDGRNTTAPFSLEANKCCTWDIPFHIDTEAPEVDGFAAADGKFTFNVIDEHYAAYAAVYAEAADNPNQLGELVAETGIFEDERGTATAIELDGDVNNFVIVGDYAGNVAAYKWDGSELKPVEVETDPEPVGSYEECVIYNYGLNLTEKQWTMFSTLGLADVYNGEAVPSNIDDFDGAGYDRENGITYSVQDGNLVKYGNLNLQNGHLEDLSVIAPVNLSFTEMAFANDLGLLFGVVGAADLYTIDVETAECTKIAEIPNGVVAMDFGTEANFYYVDAYGMLCTIDLFGDGEIVELADTGVSVLTPEGQFYTQSGCMYGNTFYWGSMDAVTQTKNLIRFDVTNGCFEGLGVVLEAPGIQMAGMFAMPDFINGASVDAFETFNGTICEK